MTAQFARVDRARRNATAALILRMLPGKTTAELADEIGLRSSTFSRDPAHRYKQVLQSLFDLLGRNPPQIQYNLEEGRSGRWFPSEH